MPHLLLEVRQQNKATLHELSQLREGYEGHADRPGLLGALGAWSAPAPDAVARPVALPRLPASALGVNGGRGSCSGRGCGGNLGIHCLFFYFVLLHITVHFFSVELCPKLNYFLTPSLEELATHEYNILWSCTQMSGHARMLRSEDSNVALSVKCFKKVLQRSGCPPPR